MNHATMYINPGVEVNLARQALYAYMSNADARSLIPAEGGYILNIFNNERGRDVDTWIEAIHGAIHDNRERHRQHERAVDARRRGLVIYSNCDGAVKPRTAKVHGGYNYYSTEVCPQCGAEL